jgi:tRNA(adenine34) deaminase
MLRAIEVAEEAARHGEVPVGAVIVCGDEELAIGQNTRERESDPCGHAEINALRAAGARRRAGGDPGGWRLDGCTIYVTLEPCAMCAGAMVLARVARCVYATADPKGGFLGTLGDLSAWPGLNHRFEVRSGVCRDVAAEQLRGFFAALRARRRQG